MIFTRLSAEFRCWRFETFQYCDWNNIGVHCPPPLFSSTIGCGAKFMQPSKYGFTTLRNIWYNNSRYQVPLITLNPQSGHTPCSLNFRVILIFRQLPSAYSIVSALLHPRLDRSAPLSFYSFLVSSRSCPVALAYKRTCVQREFHVCERHKVSTSTSNNIDTSTTCSLFCINL